MLTLRGAKAMSEEMQRLWDVLKDFVAPVAAPVGGGLIGYQAAKRKYDAEATKAEAEADSIQLDSLTRHLTALIDGYEKRIDDLTQEINQLRDEVKKLRQALDERPRPGTING